MASREEGHIPLTVLPWKHQNKACCTFKLS